MSKLKERFEILKRKRRDDLAEMKSIEIEKDKEIKV